MINLYTFLELLVILLIIIFLAGFFFYWLEHHNDPPAKGCLKGGRHHWKMIYDKRSESSGYIGSVSMWKEFECKKCGKKQKTDTGVW